MTGYDTPTLWTTPLTCCRLYNTLYDNQLRDRSGSCAQRVNSSNTALQHWDARSASLLLPTFSLQVETETDGNLVKFLREKHTNLQNGGKIFRVLVASVFPLLLPRGSIWASGFGMKRKQQIYQEVTSGTFWWIYQKTLSWMRLNFSVAFSRWINPIALCYCNQSSLNVIPRQVACQGVSVTIDSHFFISLT